MQKMIIWVVFLIVSHVAAFFGGSIVGGRISKNYLSQEFEKANAQSCFRTMRIIETSLKALKLATLITPSAALNWAQVQILMPLELAWRTTVVNLQLRRRVPTCPRNYFRVTFKF